MTRLTIATVLLSGLLAVGCGDDGDGTAGSGGTAGTAGTGGTAGAGSSVTISEDITADTTWTADNTYVLTDEIGVINATLTVEPGTTVEGQNGSALIVTNTGRLVAEGTAAEPIVFTGAGGEGSRLAGAWGGVALLGNARLSFTTREGVICDGTSNDSPCVDNVEGIQAQEGRSEFGGNDDTHDCGSLRYVRIEFAGFTFGMDNELNGLTVAGCGSDTQLSYIQVHRGLDDGVEFFGGAANADHILVSGPGDDGLDWDQGWRGTLTNLIVHHFAGTSSDPRGIEADNNSADNFSAPRSNPTVQYGTLIGDSPAADRGIVLRRGTLGRLSDFVVTSFPSSGIDVRDNSFPVNWPDQVSVDNSYFWDNNPDYEVEPTSGDDDDDNGFDEAAALADVARNNATDVDPQLGDVSGATNGGTPDYSVMISGAGAFGNDDTDWTTGWTSFPAN